LAEMERILDAGSKEFPPRLPEQPLFYPVLNIDYARQIAREWNTKDAISGYVGFVTKFDLDRDYLGQFEEHTVGSIMHRELWIPREQLTQFSAHLRSPIEMIDAYYGAPYIGPQPNPFILKNLAAEAQFPQLAGVFAYNWIDFMWEIRTNERVVRLNYKYWVLHDYSAYGLSTARKQEVLRATHDVWRSIFPDSHLVGTELVDALSG
jgi:hypothetical protein